MAPDRSVTAGLVPARANRSEGGEIASINQTTRLSPRLEPLSGEMDVPGVQARSIHTEQRDHVAGVDTDHGIPAGLRDMRLQRREVGEFGRAELQGVGR